MRTQDAKNIHINEYLERIGAKFSRKQNGTHGLEYVYHTPNRNDFKPSLCVNLDRNIWSDVPAGEGGRLIELVCYIHRYQENDVSSAHQNATARTHSNPKTNGRYAGKCVNTSIL